jgi:2,4-dienoyl-CoA reductase-like NADH-dependent reductase (Old Yellow Enzyme family)
MSALFTPINVGNLRLDNRIVIAPMCQYSAEDGCMTDWHVIHLGHLALSGAALLTIEATGTPHHLFKGRKTGRTLATMRFTAIALKCRFTDLSDNSN